MAQRPLQTPPDDASERSDRSSSATSSRWPQPSLAAVRRRLREPEHRTGSIAVLALALVPLLALAYLLYLLLAVPATGGLMTQRYEQATLVLSADGTELTRFYEKNRRWVPLGSVAEVVPAALVATEDRRFYDHSGIDVRRTVGAAFQTLGGDAQGASTLTMQLARNLFEGVGDDWVITRKFKEYLVALELERNYTKQEILELYLNTVPFNYNAWGIEAAAQTYFDRRAMALDTVQAATLVGMLKGTTLYNPRRNPEQSRERRNVVLEQMVEAGVLPRAEGERLKDQPIELDFNPFTYTNNRAPYVGAYVRGVMRDWAEENGYDLDTDGLRVYTSIDADLQETAQEVVREQLAALQAVVDVEWSRRSIPYRAASTDGYANVRENVDPFAYYWEAHTEVLPALVRRSERFQTLTEEEGLDEEAALDQLLNDGAFVDSVQTVAQRLQAGLVALEPQTGRVRAWVGGRDFEQSQYDHVADARRQPGSTFKPFVYAAALQDGYHQNSLLPDREVAYRDPTTGEVWSPSNFGGETGRMMTIAEGLAHSKNTITSQLVLDVGAARVADVARSLGIDSELDEYPSLALGTSAVTLLEMAAAYAGLANQGQPYEPQVITRIEDAEGRVLETFEAEAEPGIDAATAYGTLNMMRGVIAGGTGVRIRAQYGASGDLAGKTGTTQDNADGWFFLVHPELVIGSWVGFNSPAIAFRSRYWGQGSHNALRLVGELYQEAGLARSARFAEPATYVPPPQPDSTRFGPDTLDVPYMDEDDLFADYDSIYQENQERLEALRERIGADDTLAAAPTDEDLAADDEAEEQRPMEELSESEQMTRQAQSSQVDRALERLREQDGDGGN